LLSLSVSMSLTTGYNQSGLQVDDIDPVSG